MTLTFIREDVVTQILPFRATDWLVRMLKDFLDAVVEVSYGAGVGVLPSDIVFAGLLVLLSTAESLYFVM